MIIFKSSQKASNFNRPLIGLHGEFTLAAATRLPYFMTTMPVDRVVDELKTAEQMPPSLDNRWSLNELFQREVDRDRVQKEIVKGYLADPHKLKFFNALTVVLVPRNADDASVLTDADPLGGPAIPWDGMDEDDLAWKDVQNAMRVATPGVQYIRVGSQARIRWDQDKVHAVAVDGQHRLVALQEFRDKVKQKVFSELEAMTGVPVIVLLLSPQLGFSGKKADSLGAIRSVARELFTDLNKNARKIDSARELILDDHDLSARCVRELVTDETCQDSSDRIPLSLIRWQDAVNRFDKSYFLNSLVHLSAVMNELLELPKLEPMELYSVESYIKHVGVLFGQDKEVVRDSNGQSLLDYYHTNYCLAEAGEDLEATTPFARVPDHFVESAMAGFRERIRPWLVRLLTGFRPYRHLMEYARKNELITGTFAKWQSQTTSHKALLKEQNVAQSPSWYQDSIERHVEEIQKFKESGSDADWSFKAIFQKALVRMGKVLEMEQNDPVLGGVDDLIAVMDRLHSHGLFNVRRAMPGHTFPLWAFVGINPGNQKIKVSRTVELTIFAALRLWYYAARRISEFTDLNDPGQSAESVASRILTEFRTKRATTQWPDVNNDKTGIARLEKAFSSSILYRASGIGQDDEDQLPAEELEVKKRALVESRLKAFLSASFAGLGFAE